MVGTGVEVGLGVAVGALVGVADGVLVGPTVGAMVGLEAGIAVGAVVGAAPPIFTDNGCKALQLMMSFESEAWLILESASLPALQSKDKVAVPAVFALIVMVAKRVSVEDDLDLATLSSQLLIRNLLVVPPSVLALK